MTENGAKCFAMAIVYIAGTYAVNKLVQNAFDVMVCQYIFGTHCHTNVRTFGTLLFFPLFIEFHEHNIKCLQILAFVGKIVKYSVWRANNDQ